MMDHTASKPGCQLTALPTGGRPPAWMATAQEPVTTPSLDSDLWTNNFHLNPSVLCVFFFNGLLLLPMLQKIMLFIILSVRESD